jgi:hypothetical protein
MGQDLIAGRQVPPIAAKLPPDVPRSKQPMRLVQPDVGIGVVPHAAGAATPVNDGDPGACRQQPTGDSGSVQACDARTDDAGVHILRRQHRALPSMPFHS